MASILCHEKQLWLLHLLVQSRLQDVQDSSEDTVAVLTVATQQQVARVSPVACGQQLAVQAVGSPLGLSAGPLLLLLVHQIIRTGEIRTSCTSVLAHSPGSV